MGPNHRVCSMQLVFVVSHWSGGSSRPFPRFALGRTGATPGWEWLLCVIGPNEPQFLLSLHTTAWAFRVVAGQQCDPMKSGSPLAYAGLRLMGYSKHAVERERRFLCAYKVLQTNLHGGPDSVRRCPMNGSTGRTRCSGTVSLGCTAQPLGTAKHVANPSGRALHATLLESGFARSF